jgi:hypothetical protein
VFESDLAASWEGAETWVSERTERIARMTRDPLFS